MLNIFLVILGMVSRLIPHPANFTVIGGMTVWMGSKRQSIWVPLLSMLGADLILGFDSLYMRLVVYGGVILMYLAGKKFGKNLWIASLLGSFGFFVVTNLGVWAISTMYAKTPMGLIQCFYMALPFWRNALLADVIFTQIFKRAEIWLPQIKMASYTV